MVTVNYTASACGFWWWVSVGFVCGLGYFFWFCGFCSVVWWFWGVGLVCLVDLVHGAEFFFEVF